MEINSVVKTDKGTITFSGELSQEEADIVISIGLNHLLSQGAIPWIQEDLESLLTTEEEQEDQETDEFF